MQSPVLNNIFLLTFFKYLWYSLQSELKFDFSNAYNKLVLIYLIISLVHPWQVKNKVELLKALNEYNVGDKMVLMVQRVVKSWSCLWYSRNKVLEMSIVLRKELIFQVRLITFSYFLYLNAHHWHQLLSLYDDISSFN